MSQSSWSLNGDKNPEGNTKTIERSSLSILIGSRESRNSVESNKETSNPVFERGKDEQSVEVQDLGASNIESNKHPFMKILEDVGKASTSSHAESQGSRITFTNPNENPETQLGVQMSHNKSHQRKTKKPCAHLCKGKGNISVGSLGSN